MLVPYVDSDYTGNVDTRKTLTRYVFTFLGIAVSCKSTLQLVVALSTTETEYIALIEVVKELYVCKVWLGIQEFSWGR